MVAVVGGVGVDVVVVLTNGTVIGVLPHDTVLSGTSSLYQVTGPFSVMSVLFTLSQCSTAVSFLETSFSTFNTCNDIQYTDLV